MELLILPSKDILHRGRVRERNTRYYPLDVGIIQNLVSFSIYHKKDRILSMSNTIFILSNGKIYQGKNVEGGGIVGGRGGILLFSLVALFYSWLNSLRVKKFLKDQEQRLL